MEWISISIRHYCCSLPWLFTGLRWKGESLSSCNHKFYKRTRLCDYLTQIQDPELDNMSAMTVSISGPLLHKSKCIRPSKLILPPPKLTRPAQPYRRAANTKSVRDSIHYDQLQCQLRASMLKHFPFPFPCSLLQSCVPPFSWFYIFICSLFPHIPSFAFVMCLKLETRPP